ncbi:MAG: hypothetical protein IPM60_03365 [Rhodospirillales bacterium]|nr:hypothetical protein [Rhodospirillales bacterium]
MEDFLRSKPMLTPLVAGASVTMITGTLVRELGFPGAWTGLALSLLFGVVLLFDTTIKILAIRAVFYLLNSLTVFSVAAGLNAAGAAAVGAMPPAPAAERELPRGGEAPSDTLFQPWFGR